MKRSLLITIVILGVISSAWAVIKLNTPEEWKCLESELKSEAFPHTYQEPSLFDNIVQNDGKVITHYDLKTKEEYQRLLKKDLIYGYYVNCRLHENGTIDYEKIFYLHGKEFVLGKGTIKNIR
ncbi:hypothetical protein IEN85_10590 [Pelagicoccus sp. NFK12]|uniref:Uncharacterized protein n=2 Tax=Pelagicoccus enzymogenes TaxID=2773457 RepID=A0A927F900_9BACT|nr:hypothetical protein [Pelagicoccus enzymogenes]MBD5779658.1 hypothetical protein [Pelagicoccus enzymogenes]MBD5779805.1 hypothetical protein [Pelagicoccus enzymogenes]MBD5779812.1 hypothetical protein [Pelagicoccus enzymogenes]MBD5779936.1 hypothetical protein [Pelagicoccus enzymogenes]